MKKVYLYSTLFYSRTWLQKAPETRHTWAGDGARAAQVPEFRLSAALIFDFGAQAAELARRAICWPNPKPGPTSDPHGAAIHGEVTEKPRRRPFFKGLERSLERTMLERHPMWVQHMPCQSYRFCICSWLCGKSLGQPVVFVRPMLRLPSCFMARPLCVFIV